jgi:hypothetical protein
MADVNDKVRLAKPLAGFGIGAEGLVAAEGQDQLLDVHIIRDEKCVQCFFPVFAVPPDFFLPGWRCEGSAATRSLTSPIAGMRVRLTVQLAGFGPGAEGLVTSVGSDGLVTVRIVRDDHCQPADWLLPALPRDFLQDGWVCGSA